MQGFDEVGVATIMKAALEGLNYMHIHGRIHRDIKVVPCLAQLRFLIIPLPRSPCQWQFVASHSDAASAPAAECLDNVQF